MIINLQRTLSSGRERSMPTPTRLSGLQRTSVTEYSPSAHSSVPTPPTTSALRFASQRIAWHCIAAQHSAASGVGAADPRACP
eukprot:1452811-Rhodomonas_salina.2